MLANVDNFCMKQKLIKVDKDLEFAIQKIADAKQRSWVAQAIYLLKTHPEVQKVLNPEDPA